MMRLLRLVNVDYLSVGWYQSAASGNYVSRQLLESQQQYQESIEESFVVIYGTGGGHGTGRDGTEWGTVRHSAGWAEGGIGGT